MCLMALNNELLVEFIIGYRKPVRPAAYLAVFNVGLCSTLRGIDKSVIDFSAIGASEFRAL